MSSMIGGVDLCSLDFSLQHWQWNLIDVMFLQHQGF